MIFQNFNPHFFSFLRQPTSNHSICKLPPIIHHSLISPTTSPNPSSVCVE
jgi:hypothetical protein